MASSPEVAPPNPGARRTRCAASRSRPSAAPLSAPAPTRNPPPAAAMNSSVGLRCEAGQMTLRRARADLPDLLVGAEQPSAELTTDSGAERRMRRHELVEIGSTELEQLRVGDGGHGRRARLAQEQSKLAEERAWAERGQRRLRPADRDGELARFDEVGRRRRGRRLRTRRAPAGMLTGLNRLRTALIVRGGRPRRNGSRSSSMSVTGRVPADPIVPHGTVTVHSARRLRRVGSR